MTDAQDTLKDRLEHAQCLVDTFFSAEMYGRTTPRLTDALLWSLKELLKQAPVRLSGNVPAAQA